MARRKRSGGRPSKFTPATVLAIVADIASGLSRERAAREAGVGASTLYRWLHNGRAGDPRFTPLVDAVRGAEEGAACTLVLLKLALKHDVR